MMFQLIEVEFHIALPLDNNLRGSQRLTSQICNLKWVVNVLPEFWAIA